MPVIPTVSGGISLLSSSLMPYRTLLTSCDDMNIYVVPLYRPHGGKTQNGLSGILCFSKTCQIIDSEERFVLWSKSGSYPVSLRTIGGDRTSERKKRASERARLG